MISNKELADIEERLGLALKERNGPHARLLLEYDLPALLKDARELRATLRKAGEDSLAAYHRSDQAPEMDAIHRRLDGEKPVND